MKFLNKQSATKQNGFALVEVLIVLSVIAVLVSVVLTRSQTADNAQNAQRVVADVSLIVTQTRVWKGAGASYAGLATNKADKDGVKTLVGMGLLNSSMTNNPMGGKYELYESGTGDVQFTVVAKSLGDKLCANVLNKLSDNAATAKCTGTGDTKGDFEATYN